MKIVQTVGDAWTCVGTAVALAVVFLAATPQDLRSSTARFVVGGNKGCELVESNCTGNASCRKLIRTVCIVPQTPNDRKCSDKNKNEDNCWANGCTGADQVCLGA